MSQTKRYRLRPLSSNEGEVVLEMSYFDKQKKRNVILTSDGQVGDPDSKEMRLVLKNRDVRIEQISIRDGKPYIIEVGAGEKNTPDAQKIDILSNHNFVKVVGKTNPNLTNAMFELVDLTKEYSIRRTDQDKQLEVVNAINNMAPKRLFNLLFALGYDPRTETKDAHLYSLRSKILTDVTFAKKVSGYLNIEDFEMEVNIQKAVKYGILVRKADDTYHFNDKVLGNSIASVMSYFQNDDELYSKQIVPSIEAMDKQQASSGKKNAGSPAKAN